MTDGIIQKVLSFMYKEYLKHPDMSIGALINMTEQELIEEIKKEAFRRGKANFLIVQTLIGDNE